MLTRRSSKETLDGSFLELRSRTLELAAAIDRIERGEGGAAVARSDPRLVSLRRAFALLAEVGRQDRAEQVQLIFSLE